MWKIKMYLAIIINVWSNSTCTITTFFENVWNVHISGVLKGPKEKYKNVGGWMIKIQVKSHHIRDETSWLIIVRLWLSFSNQIIPYTQGAKETDRIVDKTRQHNFDGPLEYMMLNSFSIKIWLKQKKSIIWKPRNTFLGSSMLSIEIIVPLQKDTELYLLKV